MHLARDAPALVLLREDQAGEQLGARAFGVGLLALGEIEVGADDADDRTAGLAADRKTARQHVDVVAVLVPEAELALVGRFAARDALVDVAARAAGRRDAAGVPRR